MRLALTWTAIAAAVAASLVAGWSARAETMIVIEMHRPPLRLRSLFLLGAMLVIAAAVAATAAGAGSPNLEIMAIDSHGRAANLTRDPATDVAPAVARGGRIVFVSTRDGSGDLYVREPSGAVRRLTVNSGVSGSLDTLDFSQATWSPDAGTVAFDGLYTAVSSNCLQHCANWNVLTVGADGSGLKQIALNARAPAWSPTGRRLAYESDLDSYFTAHGVTIARRDGSEAVQLMLINQDSSVGPVWSPSDRELALQGSKTEAAPSWIYIVGADGRRPRRVAPGHDPSWAPDGGFLAYINRETLMTIARDGTHKRRLSRVGEHVTGAAWSPKGGVIAYIAGEKAGRYGGSPTNLRVETVSTDGKRLRVLRRESPTSLIWGDPVWTPDGERIIITLER